MAISPFKTWSAGEVLTAADLNSSFTQITGNALSLISPLTGTLDADGNKIILDADQDTSITADTDDQIDFEIGGSDLVSFTASNFRLSTAGLMFINESANANMTTGLTINQGAADDEILALKSSDVAHGVTAQAETDTYCLMRKSDGDGGGVSLLGYGDGDHTLNNIIHLHGVHTAALDTTKGTTAYAGVCVSLAHANGTGSNEVTANGNLFAVKGYIGGDSARCVFIVDEDGDFYYDGADGGAFDAWDDAALLRGLDLWRSDEYPDTVGRHILASRFDGNRYEQQDLGQAKLIAPVSLEAWNAGARSHISGSQEARLVRGAIWQNHEMLDALMEAIDSALEDLGQLANFQQTYVRPRFEARGLPCQILDWDGPIPPDLVRPDVAPKAFNAAL